MTTLLDFSVGFGMTFCSLYCPDYVIGEIRQWIYVPVARKKTLRYRFEKDYFELKDFTFCAELRSLTAPQEKAVISLIDVDNLQLVREELEVPRFFNQDQVLL